jgi:glycosyltransferase involved in cell wall biosynthesis
MKPRLLTLGPVNHPHVEHLALAMSERGFDVTVAGPAERMLAPSVLPAAGVRVVDAPELPHRTASGVAVHVRWIRRLRRELSPDVVQAHWLCGFAAFAALARATPLAAVAWGSDVLRAGRVKTLANRIALRGARVAMADSYALLDRLVELGARREETMLVNWGVDLDAFAPANGTRFALRERLGLGPGPVVLSPRSLTPNYNPHTVLAAFALVAEEIPDAQLVLKHMGLEPPLEIPHPAAGRVHVVGHVPHGRMADYYRVADVCVSIASSDSSPRSVWEAMACGCPVVVSDLPWVREQIEPDGDALVVPIDAQAVAGGVRRILDGGETAGRLAARGRALVEAHHDRAAAMDRVADALHSLAR